MKIYLASSWKNHAQPAAFAALRAAGHDVYDFRHPTGPDSTGFAWDDIDCDWRTWGPEELRDQLDHAIARDGFGRDMDALAECDCVIGLEPFGRSASMEMGWAAGNGKYTILVLASGEPELMVRMFDDLCLSLDEAIALLAQREMIDARAVQP